MQGLLFPPDCLNNEVSTLKEFALAAYRKADMWSGIFNRSLESVLIKSAIDFYKAAEHSKNMYVQALKEKRWNDAAFIVLDEIIPTDLVSVGRRADAFYKAIDEGRGLDALELAGKQAISVAIDKATPEPVQKAIDKISKGMAAVKVVGEVAREMTLEYAKHTVGRLDANSKADRSFYGAMNTESLGRAAMIAGENTQGGVSGKSKYLMRPINTPSYKTIDTFAKRPSPLQKESLQYAPTYEEIVN